MKYIVRTTTICSNCGESIAPGRDISNPSDWTYTEIDSSTPCNKIICPRCCGDNATEKYYEELVKAGFCYAEGIPLPLKPDLRSYFNAKAEEQLITGFFYGLTTPDNYELVGVMLRRWAELAVEEAEE